MFIRITTVFFFVCSWFYGTLENFQQIESKKGYGENENIDDNQISEFYKKILSLIPNAKNLKDLGTVATVRYRMRDEINNAIIFSAQYLKKNKDLIHRMLFLFSENDLKDDKSIDADLYSNDVAILLIIKSLQILDTNKDIEVDFSLYSIFERLGAFSKKINFLFNINELTYPEHLIISYDATDDIEYLKMLVNYLDITEEDKEKLFNEVSKINFNNISDEEKDVFKKFVFLKHVISIIKHRKDLFEQKREELLKSVNTATRKNFNNIFEEN